MSLLSLFAGNINELVNEYIDAIITKVAANYGVTKNDVEFIVRFEPGKPTSSKYFMITKNGFTQKFFISDDNLKKLIVNAKK